MGYGLEWLYDYSGWYGYDLECYGDWWYEDYGCWEIDPWGDWTWYDVEDMMDQFYGADGASSPAEKWYYDWYYDYDYWYYDDWYWYGAEDAAAPKGKSWDSWEDYWWKNQGAKSPEAKTAAVKNLMKHNMK